MSPSDAVRQFSLYGESEHLPDVLHCEAIAERSVLTGWEFAPHRHARLHQLLLVRKGRGTARLDEAAIALSGPMLVNVPIGAIHAFQFEPSTDGLVLTIADALLDELLARDHDVRRILCRAWTGPATRQVCRAMGELAEEFNGRAAGRAMVLRGLCHALLGRAARLVAVDSGPKYNAESKLHQRFETLLESNFKEHWKVADYARALAVTPTHLSRATRLATGQSASRLIDDRVIREARRQLAFTNLGIATIAFSLGFVDPAFFSRVFTRVAGHSPRDFRRHLARG